MRSRSTRTDDARTPIKAVRGAEAPALTNGGRSPLAKELLRGRELTHELLGSLGAVLLLLDLAARVEAAPARRKRIEDIAAALRASCQQLTNVGNLLVSSEQATEVDAGRVRRDHEEEAT
jgi:hypothetical protein